MMGILPHLGTWKGLRNLFNIFWHPRHLAKWPAARANLATWRWVQQSRAGVWR